MVGGVVVSSRLATRRRASAGEIHVLGDGLVVVHAEVWPCRSDGHEEPSVDGASPFTDGRRPGAAHPHEVVNHRLRAPRHDARRCHGSSWDVVTIGRGRVAISDETSPVSSSSATHFFEAFRGSRQPRSRIPPVTVGLKSSLATGEDVRPQQRPH